MQEMMKALSKAKMDLTAAIARGSGIPAAREKLKNLLFNYAEDLIKLAQEKLAADKECEKLKSDIAMLEAALEETDQENDELRKQLKGGKNKQVPVEE